MSEQSERSSYQQSYTGRLVDIETAPKPVKKSKKIENKLYDILGLVESFKTMNRPGPTRPEPSRP